MDIKKKLFEMQDLKYKEFHSKLIPTVNPEFIIGVRTPELRKFAKELAKNEESRKFTDELPHTYYEENNLHAFIVEQFKDFSETLSETEKFLPYIDNWATCDMFTPKALKKNKDALLPYIMKWIKSDKTYTVRYAIVQLMNLYLDEDFKKDYLEAVALVESEEYYIKMAVAWYFATALSKKYDETLPYIINKRLDVWTHNKAIQKAVESNRISKKTKEYLKTLKLRV